MFTKWRSFDIYSETKLFTVIPYCDVAYYTMTNALNARVGYIPAIHETRYDITFQPHPKIIQHMSSECRWSMFIVVIVTTKRPRAMAAAEKWTVFILVCLKHVDNLHHVEQYKQINKINLKRSLIGPASYHISMAVKISSMGSGFFPLCVKMLSCLFGMQEWFCWTQLINLRAIKRQISAE